MATREQFDTLANLLVALQENAEGYWVGEMTYRYATTYDGETRIYRGVVDLEAFERDVLRQSGQPSVDVAIEAARSLTRRDDIDWVSNVVENRLDRA